VFYRFFLPGPLQVRFYLVSIFFLYTIEKIAILSLLHFIFSFQTCRKLEINTTHKLSN
jgi:hypothetical protein